MTINHRWVRVTYQVSHFRRKIGKICPKSYAPDELHAPVIFKFWKCNFDLKDNRMLANFEIRTL